MQYHETIAVLVARVLLGLLFLFQGADAVFGVGMRNVYDAVKGPLVSRGVPAFWVRVGAIFTSLVQLTCGILLLAGLFRYEALYLLGFDLVVAVVGLGFASPLIDTRHIFPRAALLLFLLMIPAELDVISLDHLLFAR